MTLKQRNRKLKYTSLLTWHANAACLVATMQTNYTRFKTYQTTGVASTPNTDQSVSACIAFINLNHRFLFNIIEILRHNDLKVTDINIYTIYVLVTIINWPKNKFAKQFISLLFVAWFSLRKLLSALR